MGIDWRAACALTWTAAAVAPTACSSTGGNEVPAPLAPAGTAAISATAWTDGRWPFTVREGELRCYVEDSMVTFTANGVEYGLSGTARMFGGFSDIDQIRPGETRYLEINGQRQPVESNRISMTGVLSLGERLCPPI